MDLELNELIEEGLQLLGAEKHLEFFNNNEESKVDDSVKRDKFFKGKLEGVNPRDLMNSDTFFWKLKKT
jgi:hypothetical protein